MNNERPKDNNWTEANLANTFVDGAYATVKGYVRTYVLHHQLMEHLPPAPARVLDVGGGAGHQSFPLARAGYDVTLLDPDPTMLTKAEQRLTDLPKEAQQRITLVQADGEHASTAVGSDRFDAVLCHGVLGYLPRPEPLVAELCKCAADGGIVSVMTSNAKTMAIRPALEQRWDDALAAFDTDTEIGVLGVASRGDTVEHLEELIQSHGVRSLGWYGVWLFADLLGFSGTDIESADRDKVAAVELQASRQDPYRQMSRVFHLLGRKTLPHS